MRLVLGVALCCFVSTIAAPTKTLTSDPIHKRNIFVGTRKFAFQASPLPTYVNQNDATINCHETALHDYTTSFKNANQPSRARAGFGSTSPLQPSEWQLKNTTMRFCYFGFISDDVNKVGTPERPNLSYPQRRTSVAKGDFRIFGNSKASYADEQCLFWRASSHPNFFDTHGYTFYPVKDRPFFRLSGILSPGMNTRPLSETQVVSWRVVFDSWGDGSGTIFELGSGEFVFRRESETSDTSILAGGSNQIPPINLMGFENGYIVVTMQTRYESGNPSDSLSDGIFTVCDEYLEFSFTKPADAFLYASTTARAINESTWFRTSKFEGGSIPALGPAPIDKEDEPVMAFDFQSKSLTSEGVVVKDIGASCEGKATTFEKQILFGKAKDVLRFQAGGGLTLDIENLVNTGDHTEFTLMMMVKMEKTSCYVRILNLNPEQDNGVYFCDGVQLTPESPAGSTVSTMTWHHLAISTSSSRRTQIYIDGALEKDWAVTRANWKAGMRISGTTMHLFNDCGSDCKCENKENSAGWIAGLKLYNHVVEKEVVYEDYMSYRSSGWIANYDFSKNTLASLDPIINAPHITDIGVSCNKQNAIVFDRVSNNQQRVLSISKGTGVSIDLTNLLIQKNAASEYTIIMKIKFDSVGETKFRRILNMNGGEDKGLYLRYGHITLFPEADDDVGLGLRPLSPHVWYTIAVSTKPDRTTRVYVDGQLTREWQPSEDNWGAGVAIVSPYISILNDAGNVCDVNDITDTENTGGQLKNVLLFNTVLATSEILQYSQMLGSEAVFTQNAKAAGGGVVPVNMPCVFPFVVDGEKIYSCTTKNSGTDAEWCSTTEVYTGNTWGYCAHGAGYLEHDGMSVDGHGIGTCVGVLACQRDCDSKYECVGFALDRAEKPLLAKGTLVGALLVTENVGMNFYVKTHVAPIVDIDTSKSSLEMGLSLTPLGGDGDRNGAVTQPVDIGGTCTKPGVFQSRSVAEGTWKYPDEWSELGSSDGTSSAGAEYWQERCSTGDFEHASAHWKLRVDMGQVKDYYMGRDGAALCEALTSGDKHLWAPMEDQTYVKPVYFNRNGHVGGSAIRYPKDGRRYLSFWGSSTQVGGCCANAYNTTAKWDREMTVSAKWASKTVPEASVFHVVPGTGVAFKNAGDLLPNGAIGGYSFVLLGMFEGISDSHCARVWSVGETRESGGLDVCDKIRLVTPVGTYVGIETLTALKWYTIALTTSSNGLVQVFLNGNLQISHTLEKPEWESSLSVSENYFSLFNAEGKAMGCSPDVKVHAPTDFARFLLYDRPLSSAEISSIARSFTVPCPRVDNVECGGHGVCRSGVCECHSSRLERWKGPSCAIRGCVGDPECNSRGRCVEGECVCYEPEDKTLTQFRGSSPAGPENDCMTLKCPGDSVVDGAWRMCNGHGRCNAGSCVCDEGYRGVESSGWLNDCSVKVCPGDIRSETGWTSCSGHGTCTESGICSCNPSFTGIDCSIPVSVTTELELENNILGNNIYWRHGEESGPSVTKTVDGLCKLDGTIRLHSSFWVLRGESADYMVEPETRFYDGTQDWKTPDVHTDIALDWNADYTITMWVRTKATSASLLSKVIPGQQWGPNQKLFSILDSRLQLDVGWEGSLSGSRKVNDNTWHNVAVQFVKATNTYTLVVDGRNDVSGFISTNADPPGSITLVSAGSPDKRRSAIAEFRGVQALQSIVSPLHYGPVIARLNGECRPSHRLIFPTTNGGRLDIDTTGLIIWVKDFVGEDDTYVTHLDHILYAPTTPAHTQKTLAYADGSSAYGGNYRTPTLVYQGGLCMTTGLMRRTSFASSTTILAQVDPKCFPRANMIFVTVSGDFATRVDLEMQGKLRALRSGEYLNTGPRQDWISLDGIYWVPESGFVGPNTGSSSVDSFTSPTSRFTLAPSWGQLTWHWMLPKLDVTSSFCIIHGLAKRVGVTTTFFGTVPEFCRPSGSTGMVKHGIGWTRTDSAMGRRNSVVDIEGKVTLEPFAYADTIQWYNIILILENHACPTARFAFKNVMPGQLSVLSETQVTQCHAYRLVIGSAAAFVADSYCGMGTASLKLDGTSDSFGHVPGLGFNAGSFTFAAWVKISALNRDMTLFSYGKKAVCKLSIAGSKRIECTFETVFAKEAYSSNQLPFDSSVINTWNHVAVVRDDSSLTVRFHWNFAVVGSTGSLNPGAIEFEQDGVMVGARTSAPQENFMGLMTDVIFEKEIAIPVNKISTITNCKFQCPRATFFLNGLSSDSHTETSAPTESGCSGYTASVPDDVTLVRDLACKGNAVQLDGSADSLIEASGIHLDLPSFTVAMWVRFDTATRDMTLFSYGRGEKEPSVRCQARLYSAEHDIHCSMCDSSWSSGPCAEVASSTLGIGASSVGAWMHIAVVRDSPASVVRFFVNGVARGTSPLKGVNVKNLRHSNHGLRFGGIGHHEIPGNNLIGAIGEINILKSPGDVANLMQCSGLYDDGTVVHYTFDQKDGRDMSGIANGLTLSAAGFESTQSLLGTALVLDGQRTVGVLKVPKLTGLSTSAVSVVCWIRLKAHTPWASIFSLIDGNRVGLSLGLDDKSGQNLMWMFNTNQGEAFSGRVSGGDTLPLNEWLHVAATYSNNKLNIYLNTKLTLSSTVSDFAKDSMKLVIGQNPTKNAYIKADIAEITVYNFELVSSDVQDLYDDASLPTALPQEIGVEQPSRALPDLKVCTSSYFAFEDVSAGSQTSLGKGWGEDVCLGREITTEGSTSWAFATYCRAGGLKFDGDASGYAEVSDLHLNTGSMTFAAWVAIGAASHSHSLFSYGSPSDPSIQCSIEIGAGISCMVCDTSWVSGSCTAVVSEKVGWDSGDVGVWRHVVITRDFPQSVMRFFVDGELYGEVAFSGKNTKSLRTSKQPLRIGSTGQVIGTGHFSGEFSEVIITTLPATAAVVSSMMSCSSSHGFKTTVTLEADNSKGVVVNLPKRDYYCISVSGEATSNLGGGKYKCDGSSDAGGMPECDEFNFGHPRLSVIASLGRSCNAPTSACGTFVGQSAVIYAQEPTKLQLLIADFIYGDNTGSFIAVVENCTSSQIYSNTPSMQYRFESSLADSSGNGNNLMMGKGSATYVPSDTTTLGYAASLSGQTYMIKQSPSRSPVDTLSISLWIRARELVPGAGIVEMKSSSDSQSWSLRMDADTGSRLEFSPKTNASTEWKPFARSSGSIAQGVWTHVALTYDSSELVLYIDGALDSEHRMDTPLEALGNLVVGYSTSHGLGAYLKADIAVLDIYDRELDAKELNQAYLRYVGQSTDTRLRGSNTRGINEVACEGEQMRLMCDEGKVISVITADYGRSSRSVCSAGKTASTTDCHDAGADSTVSDICNFKSECVINVDRKVFNAPCASQSHYLSVTYSCVKSSGLCKERFFRGPTPLYFDDAQDYCIAHGGRLAVVDTQQKAAELEKFCVTDCGWLGARCTDREEVCGNDGLGDHWYWEDEAKQHIKPMSQDYTNWDGAAGPVSSSGVQESCACYTSGGKWGSCVCRDSTPWQLMNPDRKDAYSYGTTNGYRGCLSCISDQYALQGGQGWDVHGFQQHVPNGGMVWVDLKEEFYVTKFAVSGYPGDVYNGPDGDWYLEASRDNGIHDSSDYPAYKRVGSAPASKWKHGFNSLSVTYPFDPENIITASSTGPYRFYRIWMNHSPNDHMLIENLGLWGYKAQQMKHPVCETIGQPTCTVAHDTHSYSGASERKGCFQLGTPYLGTVDSWDGVNKCISWEDSPLRSHTAPGSHLEKNYCRLHESQAPWCYDVAHNIHTCSTIPMCDVDTVGFTITPGIDHPGNDISSDQGMTLNQCADSCMAIPQCLGFLSTPNMCYRKFSMSAGVSQAPGCFAGIRQSLPGADLIGHCAGTELKQSTYPLCGEECKTLEGCKAIRWLPETNTCHLMSSCSNSNNDPAYRHRAMPYINPCTDINCNHGTCKAMGSGNAICECDSGFKGRFCEYQAWSEQFSKVKPGTNCQIVMFQGNGFPAYEQGSSYLKVIATLSHRNYNSTSGWSLSSSSSAHDAAVVWIEEIVKDRFKICFQNAGVYEVSAHNDLYIEYFATDLQSVFGATTSVGSLPVSWANGASTCTTLPFRQPYKEQPLVLSTVNRKNCPPSAIGSTPRPLENGMAHWLESFVKVDGMFTGVRACVRDHSSSSEHVRVNGIFIDWIVVDPYEPTFEGDGVATGTSTVPTSQAVWTADHPLKRRVDFRPGFDSPPTSVIAQVRHTSNKSGGGATVAWLENVEGSYAYVAAGEDGSATNQLGEVTFDILAFR